MPLWRGVTWRRWVVKGWQLCTACLSGQTPAGEGEFVFQYHRCVIKTLATSSIEQKKKLDRQWEVMHRVAVCNSNNNNNNNNNLCLLRSRQTAQPTCIQWYIQRAGFHAGQEQPGCAEGIGCQTDGSQSYNTTAVGDKDEQIRFWGQKVTVVLRPNMVKKALWQFWRYAFKHDLDV